MSRLNASTFVVLSALALGGDTVHTASAQDVRIEIATPKQGDQKVTGFVTPPERAPRTLIVELYASADASAPLVGRFVLDDVNGRTGAFAFTVPALSGGKVVVRTVDSTISTTRNVEPKPKASPLPPPSLSPLTAGQREIHGFVKGPGKATAAIVEVRRMQAVQQRDAAPSTGTHLVQRLATIDRQVADKIDATGGFVATLARPMLAGDRVGVAACTDAEATDCGTEEVYDVADSTDWGRARAYFSGGAVFSQERDEFSQQDLFLALVTDKAWLQRGDPDAVGAPRADDDPKKPVNAIVPRQLNTFFDVRLTSLPVVASDSGSSGAPPSAATPADNIEQFVSSRKGAVVQIGAYVPFYGTATTWLHAGGPHALFFAPVFRIGFQTIPGDRQSLEAVAVGADDVYRFWSGGFGVGLLKLTGTRNRAPEVISYLHLTWGHYEAFEYPRDPANPASDIAKPLRTVAEARLKIPETPLQIGFDANLGEGHDDVRFSFGVRFDIGDLLAKLKQFQ